MTTTFNLCRFVRTSSLKSLPDKKFLLDHTNTLNTALSP